MATWALDSNGDWTINDNIFTALNGNYEIIQNVETRIKEQVNDCFFNLKAGIDWINMPRGQEQINELVVQIKNIIASTDGVTSVIEIIFNFDSVNRKLNVQAIYKTIYTDLNTSQLLFDI